MISESLSKAILKNNPIIRCLEIFPPIHAVCSWRRQIRKDITQYIKNEKLIIEFGVGQVHRNLKNKYIAFSQKEFDLGTSDYARFAKYKDVTIVTEGVTPYISDAVFKHFLVSCKPFAKQIIITERFKQNKLREFLGSKNKYTSFSQLRSNVLSLGFKTVKDKHTFIVIQ